MKNVVIIQARMGSTRLPGKVLKQLFDKTVLGHVIARSKLFLNVHEIVVATTTSNSDNLIVEECKKQGVQIYRGSETDVLSRYYEAASLVKADSIIRVTSDCPLIDPEVSSGVLNEYLKRKACDYVSNTLERTYPRGLDTEVFSFTALESAYYEARQSPEREHVTPYLYNNPRRFSCHSVANPNGVIDYRWTLDTPEDWELIERIYKHLYHADSIFTWKEALKVMNENPEWKNINASIKQKH